MDSSAPSSAKRTRPAADAADRIAPSRVKIEPPKLQTVTLNILGTSQLVQNRFSAKARAKMEATQRQGSTAKARKARPPREFEADYKAAMYVSEKGWHGMPCTAFKAAMVSACRLTDASMELGKISLFVEPDGLDATDGTELVKIEGKPTQRIDHVRHMMTTNLAVRAAFWPWKAKLRITFDSERFQLSDVINLLMRAGLQVGIGEGRPGSKRSVGMGWGRFSVETKGVVAA
jgi:hypothetical protein